MPTLPSPLHENIPLTGPVSFSFREFDVPAFTYPWHCHPEAELTWILEGRGLRYVGDSIESFEPGDFCLLGENLPHTWLSVGADASRARCMVIQFDVRRLEPLLALPEFARIGHLLRRAAHGLRFDPALGERLLPRVRTPPSPLFRFTALLETLEILADCDTAVALSGCAWTNGRPGQWDPVLQRVFAFLAKHEGQEISQAQVAASVGMKPPAFSRFFRRATGRNFQDHLTDVRLSLACRQLVHTDDPISAIAFNSGFGNLSNFNRAFRLRHGMAPSDFRRQSRRTEYAG